MSGTQHELVIVLDFGSQYTQLIARRVRELGVYCEIAPFATPCDDLTKRRPKGVILSGGPSSIYAKDAPLCDPGILQLGIPILGICYGAQLQAHFLKGKVTPSKRREYGYARVEIVQESPLLQGLPHSFPAWMSHGDEIGRVPLGYRVVARTENSVAAMEDQSRQLYGLQFHPEVVHTPDGKLILGNFLRNICGTSGDWTMASFIESATQRISQQIGLGRAICGLSGGVDSSVAAMLTHRAIGSRLTCIFVDNGLLRKGEYEDVLDVYKRTLSLNVTGVPAGDRFLSRLRGLTDPEQKRKAIGAVFIDVFQEQAVKIGPVDFLVQGTLYPDVIESTPVRGPSSVIKSHHNVGGLPETLNLNLVEPLRELFKDEVRSVGRQLGLPSEIIDRHPFPGPGLAVRILGEVTSERLRALREADAIVIDEIRRANLYDKVWQAFAVLLPVSSVGVMGDERTYENVIAVRAITSQDGMTADWARLPDDTLASISSRIVSEVRGINRVVYDISSKPPSTIEWE